MYTAITPGRSKEYCTLQYEVHRNELPPLHASRRPNAQNCLHITEKGDAGFMALSDHKTSKHYGCDHVVLSGDSPLLRHLAGHVQLYRHILCGEQSHNYLFVVSAHGQHTLTRQYRQHKNGVHACMHGDYVCICVYMYGRYQCIIKCSIPTEQQRRAIWGAKVDTVCERNFHKVHGQRGCTFNAALLIYNIQWKPATDGRIEEVNSIQHAAHTRDGKKACKLCLCHAWPVWTRPHALLIYLCRFYTAGPAGLWQAYKAG